MAIVYGKVLTIVEDNLQFRRRIIGLEYLSCYFIQRLVINTIDCIVQRRVRVAYAVRRYVDLFDAIRVIFVATG